MSIIREAIQPDSYGSYAGDETPAAESLHVESTDAQLVNLTLSGIDPAFEQLFERHKRSAARTAAKFFRDHSQIEEIVQISFTKAFFELKKFRGEHDLSFASWLSRIAANCCLDVLRSKKRRPESLSCELSSDESEALHLIADEGLRSTEDRVAARDLAVKLLARLDGEDRALLTMLYVDELSVAEISELFGWSRSKVKIRAWRARRSLRHILGRFL